MTFLEIEKQTHSELFTSSEATGEGLLQEWSCKSYKKKCCKKYKKGSQCRRCPKLAIFDMMIENYQLVRDCHGAS